MVLDGELVAVSDDGDVDFYRLGERMLMKRPARTVTLCAFDVLRLDGIDCTQLAYRDRRRLLEMLELNGPEWCTVPRFVVDDAEDLLEASVRLREEGIVLKRVDARYVPGARSTDWRKDNTTAWRTDHGPRRLPKELRERIAHTD
jgi:bifunctional non-homologous end joining protein LigD